MKQAALTPEFVEFIPSSLQDGVIYISIPYATAVHKCCCGCGEKVVTPLSPTDWQLIFDGDAVSLKPSIGNWSFACQSHYWIERNRVRWAPRWSAQQIAAGRARDQIAKDRYYGTDEPGIPETVQPEPQPESLLLRFVRWLKSKF